MAVYESQLDFDDACEVLNIMETCDDDELEEVIESVLELVEESYFEKSKEEREKYNKLFYDNIKAIKHQKRLESQSLDFAKRIDDKVNKASRPYYLAAATATVAGGSALAVYEVKLQSLKKQLLIACSALEKAEKASDQRKIEAEIDRLQNEIRKVKKKLGVGAAITGAGIGARAAIDHKIKKTKKVAVDRLSSMNHKARDKVRRTSDALRYAH